ncbi:MAG: EamA family transporter RarD [Anaerolineae bacterium]|nr:EamA family transporter RarD [Anaerolineae bacterium]
MNQPTYSRSRTQRGLLLSLAAYIWWGFLPVYLKAVSIFPALEYFAHRIIWSALLLTAIMTLRKEWGPLKATLTLRKVAIFCVVSAVLCGNTLIYIWAVTHDRIVDASLGSFMNPLISVVMGVLILRERIAFHHKIAVGIAALGLVYLGIMSQTFPWVALVLAVTWGGYGLMKKMAPLNTLHGSWLEVVLASGPFLLYLLYLGSQGQNEFTKHGTGLDLLLIASAVITTTPLLLFTAGMRSAPLSQLGFLQYISPTIQFLLGIFVFHEPFTSTKLIGYIIVWLALLVYMFGSGLARWRAHTARAEQAAAPVKE